MISFQQSHVDMLPIEREILNSVPEFHLLSNQGPELTDEEILQQHQEATELGAERYLVHFEERPIGVLEFLPRNPSDEQPWLGLLLIHAAQHRKGLASQSYRQFEDQLRERGFQTLRLGVIRENLAGTEFWRKMGFVHFKESQGDNGIVYDCYEKEIK